MCIAISYEDVGFIVCSFSRIIVLASSLEPIIYLASGSWPNNGAL